MMCKSVSSLQESFLDHGIWTNSVECFTNEKNKYLRFASARSLVEVMCGFPKDVFKTRFKLFLGNLLCISGMEQSYYLEFFRFLLQHQNHGVCKTSSCNNSVMYSFQPLDTHYAVTYELSESWNKLTEIFLKPDNQNIYDFLQLWKCLIDKQLEEDFTKVFFDENFAVEFLKYASKMTPITSRLYVDIISQICNCKLKSNARTCYSMKIEECVLFALSSKFMEVMCHRYDISAVPNFIGRSKFSNDKYQDFDITTKQVMFIIFYIMAEFDSAPLLCQALHKVFSFLITFYREHQFLDSSWIHMIFIEEDDLLMAMMLSCLNIYSLVTLKLRECRDYESILQMLETRMNPHAIFLTFLRNVGNDHNELLAFLLSDETCFLAYLLRYLKLLLRDWPSLLAAPTDEEPSPRYLSPGAPGLVPYPSSDEEGDGPGGSSSSLLGKSQTPLLGAVPVLLRLKQAIVKLVEAKEFPYNADPLVALLSSCEEKCREVR